MKKYTIWFLVISLFLTVNVFGASLVPDQATLIEVDASGFSSNLSSTDDTVQEVAASVDAGPSIVSGAAISNSPISGSTGSFTTIDASGAVAVEGDLTLGSGTAPSSQFTIKSEGGSFSAIGMKMYNYGDSPDQLTGISHYKAGGTKASPTDLANENLGHLNGWSSYLMYNGAYRATGKWAYILSPQWNYVTHANYPETALVYGQYGDGQYDHTFILDDDRASFLGHDETLSDRYTDERLTVANGNIEVYDGSDLDAEIITDGSDFSTANWTLASDFAVSGTAARYTYSGGTGTITQAEADFAHVAIDSRRYIISVTVANMSCGTKNANLTYLNIANNFITVGNSEANTMIGDLGTGEPITKQQADGYFKGTLKDGQVYSDGTFKRAYKGATSITDFKIEVAATGACTFDITAVSAKEIIGGDILLGGGIYSGGPLVIETSDITDVKSMLDIRNNLPSGTVRIRLQGGLSNPQWAIGSGVSAGNSLGADSFYLGEGLNAMFRVDSVSDGGGFIHDTTTTINAKGFVPALVTADPCGDATAYPEASIFYNDTSDYMCYCTGAGADIKMNDNTTACF